MNTELILFIYFQSSFELTGYITSKNVNLSKKIMLFQSSFELTGYITVSGVAVVSGAIGVSKLFRAYRLYNISYLQIR